MFLFPSPNAYLRDWRPKTCMSGSNPAVQVSFPLEVKVNKLRIWWFLTVSSFSLLSNLYPLSEAFQSSFYSYGIFLYRSVTRRRKTAFKQTIGRWKFVRYRLLRTPYTTFENPHHLNLSLGSAWNYYNNAVRFTLSPDPWWVWDCKLWVLEWPVQ